MHMAITIKRKIDLGVTKNVGLILSAGDGKKEEGGVNQGSSVKSHVTCLRLKKRIMEKIKISILYLS